jgi:hypothetical protein
MSRPIETITFEVVLHFGNGGYDESITYLKQQMIRALIRSIEECEDIEVNCLTTELKGNHFIAEKGIE